MNDLQFMTDANLHFFQVIAKKNPLIFCRWEDFSVLYSIKCLFREEIFHFIIVYNFFLKYIRTGFR